MALCQVLAVALPPWLLSQDAQLCRLCCRRTAACRIHAVLGAAHVRQQRLDINAAPGHLWPMRRMSSKRQFLQAARAWNERARLVESPLFRQSDFFDPRDKVQVKYEMLRAALVDGATVSEASQQFGYSRESFYTSAQLLRDQGIAGLADAKRGPKQPRKLTLKVRRFLVREMERDPSLSGRGLAERVAEKLAVNVHHRSVERFRSAHGKKP